MGGEKWEGGGLKREYDQQCTLRQFLPQVWAFPPQPEITAYNEYPEVGRTSVAAALCLSSALRGVVTLLQAAFFFVEQNSSHGFLSSIPSVPTEFCSLLGRGLR